MAAPTVAEETTIFLRDLVAERDATCAALGISVCAPEGTPAEVAARLIEDLERHEQLVSMLLDVAMSTEVEIQALREALTNTRATVQRQRDLIGEAMTALGVDRTSEDAASDLVAMAHEVRAWRPRPLETMGVYGYGSEAFPCL